MESLQIDAISIPKILKRNVFPLLASNLPQAGIDLLLIGIDNESQLFMEKYFRNPFL